VISGGYGVVVVVDGGESRRGDIDGWLGGGLYVCLGPLFRYIV
jgi:hypothetical protein